MRMSTRRIDGEGIKDKKGFVPGYAGMTARHAPRRRR
jgi:hypothetical protein